MNNCLADQDIICFNGILVHCHGFESSPLDQVTSQLSPVIVLTMFFFFFVESNFNFVFTSKPLSPMRFLVPNFFYWFFFSVILVRFRILRRHCLVALALLCGKYKLSVSSLSYDKWSLVTWWIGANDSEELLLSSSLNIDYGNTCPYICPAVRSHIPEVSF